MSGGGPELDPSADSTFDPAADADAVRRRVHRAVAAALGKPESSIRDGTRFLYDLEVDSIAVLDILCALEDTFDVAIDEVEAFPVETVGELVALIAAALDAPPPDASPSLPPANAARGVDAGPPAASISAAAR
ncbi:MAG: acyl carrier protein [Acidobacteriota bacterium]